MGHVQRRHVRLVVVVGLLAGAAGCGGGSDSSLDTVPAEAVAEDPAPGTTPTEQVAEVSALDDPVLVALTEAIADDVGVDAVFAAVALALDRGYTSGQLADAAGTGTITADGSITGVDPADQPYGLLVADDTAVQSLRRSPIADTTVEELADGIAPVHDDFDWQSDLDSGQQDNAVLAGVLLTLVEMGYSFDQIVVGIRLGELSVRYGTRYENYYGRLELEAFGCLALVDATGAVVVPERKLVKANVETLDSFIRRAYRCGEAAQAGDLITAEDAAALTERDESPPEAPTTTTTIAPTTSDEPAVDPPAAGFPRTYRADVGTHYLTDFAYDVPYDCTMTGPMELTLAADGTATFTYFNGVGVVATLSEDGTPQISCEPRPGNAWTGTYDTALQTFEILPPAPEGFASWDFHGTFDAKTAFAYGVYSLLPNPAGQQRIVEIEATLTM